MDIIIVYHLFDTFYVINYFSDISGLTYGSTLYFKNALDISAKLK